MFTLLRRRVMPAGSVSILIPTMFDSRYVIELCIRSIFKYTHHPDFQIIVCDAGIDKSTHEYLSELEESGKIKLITATDAQRPKDDLVRAVDTDYYVLMHDDIRIMKMTWLENRLHLMNKNPANAIVGSIVKNYGYAGNCRSRFFPLGMLVKTAASRELNLVWGKQPGFDTGAIAYQTFFQQSKYKFASYKPSKDIYHFAEMTWPKYHTHQTYRNLDEKLNGIQQKMLKIKELLDTNMF
ncbi:MAG: glycosyltransferase family 2 protein [Desulfobacteraceae bacterium]|nr:glycosyltransferase family 2 protein [Desulfobacteraceae bacterium]